MTATRKFGHRDSDTVGAVKHAAQSKAADRRCAVAFVFVEPQAAASERASKGLGPRSVRRRDWEPDRVGR